MKIQYDTIEAKNVTQSWSLQTLLTRSRPGNEPCQMLLPSTPFLLRSKSKIQIRGNSRILKLGSSLNEVLIG